MQVGQENKRHVHGRYSEALEMHQGFRRWVHQDTLSVDPDDEARHLADRIEPVACPQRRDPEARTLGGEADRVATQVRNEAGGPVRPGDGQMFDSDAPTDIDDPRLASARGRASPDS